MSPSGLGFGSDPSWRCQEERGHFAALLAREGTPAELLPEPDPPGELWAGLGENSRLCFPGWGHSPAHLGVEIFISGCVVAQPVVLEVCGVGRDGIQSWPCCHGLGTNTMEQPGKECWDSAPALLCA